MYFIRFVKDFEITLPGPASSGSSAFVEGEIRFDLGVGAGCERHRSGGAPAVLGCPGSLGQCNDMGIEVPVEQKHGFRPRHRVLDDVRFDRVSVDADKRRNETIGLTKEILQRCDVRRGKRTVVRELIVVQEYEFHVRTELCCVSDRKIENV